MAVCKLLEELVEGYFQVLIIEAEDGEAHVLNRSQNDLPLLLSSNENKGLGILNTHCLSIMFINLFLIC